MNQGEPNKSFADGKMSARFTKLKEEGSGTIFMPSKGLSTAAGDTSIDLVPGATIGGVYQIIQLLGRGGMGEVYLARHEKLGNKCALKVIPPDQVTEIGWQRFQNEAKAVAGLAHRNLVRVTDLGIHQSCLPYYAMDYVEGQNLAELLARQGPMTLKAVLDTFIQVCDGIECAHLAGILHRDLKPANIMLMDGKSEPKQVKILDFGLAKLTKQDRTKQSLTAVGDIFGSPSYMSPEQCAGEKLDNRSDIYSLGCTMFECLTGHPPFSGHLASAVMFSQMEAEAPTLESVVGPNKFPPSLEIIMAKLLRKNPAERYQWLSALKADLELLAAGREPFTAYTDHPSGPPGAVNNYGEGSSSKNTAKSLLPGVLALLAISGVAIFFLYTTWDKINTQHKKEQAAIKAANALILEDPMDDLVSSSSGAYMDSVPNSADRVRAVDEISKFLMYNLARHNYFLDSSGTTLDFPRNVFIGAIKIGEHEPALALGKMPVYKPQASLTFYQNITMNSMPYFLDMFRPTDLTGLELVQSRPAKAIEKISEWSNLTHLSFFNSLIKTLPHFDQNDESLLSDADLPAIDKMKNLQVLGLCSKASGKAVAQMELMHTISSIRLKRLKNIESILAILPSLDNIHEVWLIAESTNDSQLESLVKMKNLESLLIRRGHLTVNSISYFQRMKALKKLCLDVDWTAAEKSKLQAVLPFVQFEKQIDSTYWSLSPTKLRRRR